MPSVGTVMILGEDPTQRVGAELSAECRFKLGESYGLSPSALGLSIRSSSSRNKEVEVGGLVEPHLVPFIFLCLH